MIFCYLKAINRFSIERGVHQSF